MGGILGTDATTGGFVMGAITAAALMVIGMILSAELDSQSGVFMVGFLAFAIGLPAIFGWFPNWFIIFSALLIVGAAVFGRNVGGD